MKKYLNRIIEFFYPSNKIIQTDYKKKLISLNAYEKYKNEEMEKCYNYFKKHFKSSIFLSSDKIREYALKKSLKNDSNQNNFYLEFGVYVGKSINFFASNLKTKIYGFDSFEGLNEDWVGHARSSGHLDLKGIIPKVKNNVVLVKGEVEQTLVKFLEEKKPVINFMHIDLDTYNPSKFVLHHTKKYMAKGAIILFDDFYNFTGWDVGELKALEEVYNFDEYKYLAFSKDGSQGCIELKN